MKKPATSVTVVRMIDEDWAGSCPRALRTVGMAAPAIPATTIAITMETPMTRLRPGERLQT